MRKLSLFALALVLLWPDPAGARGRRHCGGCSSGCAPSVCSSCGGCSTCGGFAPALMPTFYPAWNGGIAETIPVLGETIILSAETPRAGGPTVVETAMPTAQGEPVFRRDGRGLLHQIGWWRNGRFVLAE